MILHRSARAFFSARNLAVCGLLVAPQISALLHAQPATRKPDDDWRDLQLLIAPAAPSAGGTKKTPVQLEADRGRDADRFFQAAQQAKDFYTRYPSDPNAANARKLEVTASLESAKLGKAAAEPAARALAAAYRADRNQLREDRFEVALAADRYDLVKKHGKPAHEKPDDFEKLADNLRREFGDIAEVFGLYAGIASTVDMESANRIATKILDMRPPPFAKAQAQAITARYGLLGRPLPLRLTTLEGQTFELGAARESGPTVLYVWTAGGGAPRNPFAPLSQQKAKVAKDVRWIYLGLAATTAQASAEKGRAPFAGTHCRDDADTRSAVAQRLKIRSSPTVFVLNRQGVLTGYGRVDELPALLAAANR